MIKKYKYRDLDTGTEFTSSISPDSLEKVGKFLCYEVAVGWFAVEYLGEAP